MGNRFLYFACNTELQNIFTLTIAVRYFTFTESIWQGLSCSDISVICLIHTSRSEKQLIIIFSTESPQLFFEMFQKQLNNRNGKAVGEGLSENFTQWSQITGMESVTNFHVATEK